MPAISVAAQYKLVVQKQQNVGVVSAALSPLVAADAIKSARADSIFLQAPMANSGNITVLNASPAVAGGRGFELPPGGNIVLPTNNHLEWFVIGSDAADKLNISYMASIV